MKRIVWAAPAEDIEVPVDGLALLNSLDISAVWVEQP